MPIYIKALSEDTAAPPVKQQLAAIRMLCNWLMTGEAMANNPAAAVRGRMYAVKTGRMPVFDVAEWQCLIEAIPTTTIRDLRDHALMITTLTYGFARIGAVHKMRVQDLQPKSSAWVIRRHEKGCNTRATKVRLTGACGGAERRDSSRSMFGRAEHARVADQKGLVAGGTAPTGATGR